jgi:hypothetical protein
VSVFGDGLFGDGSFSDVEATTTEPLPPATPQTGIGFIDFPDHGRIIEATVGQLAHTRRG